MNNINADLLQWFVTFFDKMSTSGSGAARFTNKSAIKNQNMLNLELNGEQLDNIRGVDLFDMQQRNKFIKETCFTLCVMDIFSKYACVVHLKDKKSSQPLMTFKKFQMNQDANQTKYGQIKGANFKIDHGNHGHMLLVILGTMKFLRSLMKKNGKK